MNQISANAGMGTRIQAEKLTEEQYRGDRFKLRLFQLQFRTDYFDFYFVLTDFFYFVFEKHFLRNTCWNSGVILNFM